MIMSPRSLLSPVCLTDGLDCGSGAQVLSCPIPSVTSLNPLATNRPESGGGTSEDPATWAFMCGFFFYHTKNILSHWNFCFISLEAYAKSSLWGLW